MDADTRQQEHFKQIFEDYDPATQAKILDGTKKIYFIPVGRLKRGLAYISFVVTTGKEGEAIQETLQQNQNDFGKLVEAFFKTNPTPYIPK
jgi:hypothetical protein